MIDIFIHKKNAVILIIVLLVSSTTPEFVDNYNEGCVRAMNDMRWRHGSPPLNSNKTLADNAKTKAQEFGKKLAVSRDLRKALAFKESPESGSIIGINAAGFDGELLPYRSPSYQPLPTDGGYPPLIWYREIARYNFADPKFQKDAGHFSQLVWSDTTDVGCAIARSLNTWIVVHMFYPSGNWATRELFEKNVKRPIYGGINEVPHNFSKGLSYKKYL